MAQSDWKLFFALLICDFLKAGAGEEGIPELEALPMVAQDSTTEQPRPCVVVTCESEPQGHPRVFVGTVTVTLKIHVKKGGSQPATAAGWLGALDTRLRDREAFSVWCAALDEERRTGWIIIHHKVMNGAVEANEENRTQDMTLQVGLTVKVDRGV